MIVNNLPLPALLNISGKKPWEVNHFDTLELWKFGDFKSYTSLNLLAHTLGIQTPKDDIDGSMVWEVFWKEKNLQRIVTYCQKDVVTMAQILLRMNGEALIETGNIEIKG
jgi:3'-5' exonuclease